MSLVEGASSHVAEHLHRNSKETPFQTWSSGLPTNVFPKQFAVGALLRKKHWPRPLAAPLSPCPGVVLLSSGRARKTLCPPLVLLISSCAGDDGRGRAVGPSLPCPGVVRPRRGPGAVGLSSAPCEGFVQAFRPCPDPSVLFARVVGPCISALSEPCPLHRLVRVYLRAAMNGTVR